MLRNCFILLSLLLLGTLQSFASQAVSTIYGVYQITEPVLCELLNCPTVKRLAHINQYGVNAYINSRKPYTRYEHSLGVMVLLRQFGASEKEQIAGLLHDVSHTVFSHAGGFVFNDDLIKSDSHQDDIHVWYLQQTEIGAILAKYGYTIQDIHHKNDQFRMLERSLPNICADRLEYTLYGGYVENIITLDDIHQMVQDLRYYSDEWFFVNQESAHKFAAVSCYLTEKVFGAPWDHLVMRWTASAIRRALVIGLVTEHEVHFSTDSVIWQRLCASHDVHIRRDITCIMNSKKMYLDVDEQQAEFLLASKCRCIDPLVRKNGFLFKLSKLDVEFENEFKRIKDVCKRGHPIVFTQRYKSMR